MGGHGDIFVLTVETLHVIPFWNPWDHRSYLGIVCTIFGHPQNDQEGQKYLIKSFGRILGVLMQIMTL